MSITKKAMVLSFGFCLLNGVLWAAGTPALKVGSVSAKPGAVVDLPVHFDPGSASVASLQFNLTLPTNVDTVSVTAEKMLTTSAADKSVTQRLKGRILTCMVFGLNQNKIGSGDIMSINVRVGPSAALGKLTLPVSGVVYADPNGKVIAPGKSSAGVITVTAAAK